MLHGLTSATAIAARVEAHHSAMACGRIGGVMTDLELDDDGGDRWRSRKWDSHVDAGFAGLFDDPVTESLAPDMNDPDQSYVRESERPRWRRPPIATRSRPMGLGDLFGLFPSGHRDAAGD